MPLVFDSNGGGIIFTGGAALFDDGFGNLCCCVAPCTCCTGAIRGAWIAVTGVGSDLCDCSALNDTFYAPADGTNCSGSYTDFLAVCECSTGNFFDEDIQFSWGLDCVVEDASNKRVTMTVEIRGGAFCGTAWASGLGFTGYKSVVVANEDFPVDCKTLFDGTYNADPTFSDDPSDSAGCDRPASVDLTLDMY